MGSLINEALRTALPGRRRLWKRQQAEHAEARELERALIRQYQELAEQPSVPCAASNLRKWNSLEFSDFISSPQRINVWDGLRDHLASVVIPEMSGGVNQGDQRFLVHLIEYLQPRNVLEVGTHIGASTVHIAAAMRFLVRGGGSRLVTVDIRDVNDTQSKPWLDYGANTSPRGLLEMAGVHELVAFVVSDSVEFLRKSTDFFDLIFLDGDHSAKSVYQEVPLALKRLSANGVILLHDVFPNLEPLWPERKLWDSVIQRSVIPGPFLATQRLEHEGNAFRVLPLGELPWATKVGTKVTSLALLVRSD